MDAILTIVIAIFVIGFLVFIHEGGHFLAARAFGIRVTEFMLGLPGPHVGFQHGETKFGVTLIPLGGYARICGMESGDRSPYLQEALTSLYTRGVANMEDVAKDCNITSDEAFDALMELVEWGCVTGPKKSDEFNTFRTVALKPTPAMIKRESTVGEDGLLVTPPWLIEREEGVPVAFESPEQAEAFYQREFAQQYCSLPFWKRSVILLAGVAMNFLFAMLAFVVVFTCIGVDVTTSDGVVTHVSLDPLRSIQVGFMYIGAVFQAVAGLFNPATVAETISDSTSIVGIAVISRQAFEAGFVVLLEFMAMISVSLGVMNLVPIPPLDGGRFVIEIFQRITRRNVSTRVMNAISLVGLALFTLLFVVMLNQDILRYFFDS